MHRTISEPGKLHSDYKTHSHFLPNLGGKVHLIIQKIRQIPSALTLSWEEPRVLSSESTSCPLPGMEEGEAITFTVVNYSLCVDGKREGRKFLISAVSSLPSAQNNHMPKWHILRKRI